jgi:hypothetical protein
LFLIDPGGDSFSKIDRAGTRCFKKLRAQLQFFLEKDRGSGSIFSKNNREIRRILKIHRTSGRFKETPPERQVL